MPAVKKNQPAAETARERARRAPKTQGLAQHFQAPPASEAFTPGKSSFSNDTEMTDAENLRLVGQGSASGTPTNPPSETTNVSKKVQSTQAEPTGPAVRKILKVSLVVPKNAAGTKDTVKITNRPTNSTVNPTRADQVPLELRSMIESEERRAAQTASKLTLCTAAINGVENALSALANEGNRLYIDAMKAHFRAAVAQYMTMGPGVSPNLPPRPPRPASNITFWENPPAGSTSRQPVQIFEPTTAEPGPKSSWATITKRGHQKLSVSPRVGDLLWCVNTIDDHFVFLSILCYKRLYRFPG